MMTRKDYVAIAAQIKNAQANPDHFFASNGDEYTKGVNSAAIAIASMLARDNPRFDRERFLTACGIS